MYSPQTLNMKQIKPKITEEQGQDGSPAGVEFEVATPTVDPFDPNSISIDPKQMTMDHLLRRLRQGSIRLAPTFQRNFVWDQERSSLLIESLMLRIPLPMFYVAANEDGNWDVVDGVQRLSTIRNYLLGEENNKDGSKTIPAAQAFALKNLEFWGERFNGKKFSEIKRDTANARIVNNIMETEMRFTVINPATPEEVKRNIFKRINTGGVPLTSQEIRHALYQGQSTQLLQELAGLPVFLDAIERSVDDSRMAARELVLRFLAFSIRGEREYTGDMDKFLSDTMRLINLVPDLSEAKLRKIFPGQPLPKVQLRSLEELKICFELAMTRCFQLFGEFSFRKAVPGMRRTPINKALFDSWANIFSRMSQDDFDKLKETKIKNKLIELYKEILDDANFERAISRDASSVLGTRDRYKRLQDLIKETLES